MSIIFQLFNAEDLQKLSYDELQDLRKIIIKALAPNPDKPPDNLEPLKLNLTPKTRIDENSPPELRPPPKWVDEALLKRFYEVSHQLKTPPLNQPQQAFDFDELITERKDPKNQTKEELILNWAISCEVNHMEFYNSLLKAREAAYGFFEERIKAKELQAKGVAPKEVRIKDPDSAYSPFNPRHPLQKLFYDLSKSPPTPPQSTPPSGP